jgi:nickel-dependent lactate racemase
VTQRDFASFALSGETVLMAEIQLKYGRTAIPFNYDASRFEILGAARQSRPLSDIEIGERFDDPIGSRPLEEIVSAGETVLFVVPDATRQTAAGQMINLLVRRLIANGTMPHEMAAIFATGIHRAVTEAEKQAILTPFIAQRLKTIQHDARDLAQLVRVGETSGGISVELNRALTEFDHVVLVGGVTFHYFAGFTGGRKLICPGLASSRTIGATHKLAFDCKTKDRRIGVGTGKLDGNAVHEAFVEAASFANISFAVNTIVDESGVATDVFCGDWTASHRAACEKYATENTLTISERRDIVIVSCGGYPFDLNMIQAHKALEAASKACNDGGRIVLIAECPDGLGRKDFLNWFDSENSGQMAEKLCEKYQVNGQTAWSLMKKSERFDIKIVSSLASDVTTQMRMSAIMTDAIEKTGMEGRSGFIMPAGGGVRVLTQITH